MFRLPDQDSDKKNVLFSSCSSWTTAFIFHQWQIKTLQQAFALELVCNFCFRFLLIGITHFFLFLPSVPMLTKNESLAFLVKRLLRLVKEFVRFLQKKAHEIIIKKIPSLQFFRIRMNCSSITEQVFAPNLWYWDVESIQKSPSNVLSSDQVVFQSVFFFFWDTLQSPF